MTPESLIPPSIRIQKIHLNSRHAGAMMRLKIKQAAWPLMAMGFVILGSNELVQHPVRGFIGSLDLSLVLT